MTHEFKDVAGDTYLSIDASQPVIIDHQRPLEPTVQFHSIGTEPFLVIGADGKVTWNGREVVGDEEFKQAMMDLNAKLGGINKTIQPVQEPEAAIVEVRRTDGPWQRYNIYGSVKLAEDTKRRCEGDGVEIRVVPLYRAPPTQPSLSDEADKPVDRRTLQADGKHPAPCARQCEANAFKVEIRRLESALVKVHNNEADWTGQTIVREAVAASRAQRKDQP